VAPIREQQFLFMVKHTPFLALRVMRVLANRLRRAEQGGLKAAPVARQRAMLQRKTPRRWGFDAGLSSMRLLEEQASGP
jgi:CRP-like cAMP-binding protein